MTSTSDADRNAQATAEHRCAYWSAFPVVLLIIPLHFLFSNQTRYLRVSADPFGAE